MIPITQIRWTLFIGLFQLMMACTTIPPLKESNQKIISHEFSHEKFDRILQRYVDDQERVDYTALQKQADDLETYYSLVAQYSPDNNPDLFVDESARLAYWINAYNAATLKIVLKYYPITSISEVEFLAYCS